MVKVVTIDFDIIMSPCIEFYNDLIGVEDPLKDFVKDFSLFFPKICRLCPLKKGAATENPLEYGKTEVQILFEPLQAAISSMELPKNFENKKLPNTLRRLAFLPFHL